MKMGIKNWLKRNIPGVPKDKVSFKDVLDITMRDTDGKIVKKWREVHNTWNSTGLHNVALALGVGTVNVCKVSYMLCNGTGGAEVAAVLTPNPPPAAVVVWVGTWPALGAITAITLFSLRLTTGGAAQSTVACTSFDKPTGISLEVTWTLTLSSV